MEVSPVTSFLCDLAESPVWSPRQQALFWADISGRRIHCLQPQSGAHRSWPTPSEPGAIALTDRSRIVVAMRSGFSLFDPASERFEQVAAPDYDSSRLRFNDGRCDTAGRFWAGTMDEARTQPSAGLWCLERGELRKGPHGVTLSNGLAFTPDGASMFHADSQVGEIYRYAYDLAAGQPSNKRLWRTMLVSDGLPDGAAIDAEGHYWVAMFGTGQVLRLDADANITGRVPVPVPWPTMISFGGPDLRTMYITTSRRNRTPEALGQHPLLGAIFAVSMDVPGVPEPEYVE